PASARLSAGKIVSSWRRGSVAGRVNWAHKKKPTPTTSASTAIGNAATAILIRRETAIDRTARHMFTFTRQLCHGPPPRHTIAIVINTTAISLGKDRDVIAQTKADRDSSIATQGPGFIGFDAPVANADQSMSPLGYVCVVSDHDDGHIHR